MFKIKTFRDLGIQRKLQLMTLMICGAVLLIAIASLFVFQVLTFRSNFQRDTTTLAVIIANNSAAAMAFKDELAPYKLSKGAIRFPLSEPIPIKLIERITKFRAKEVAEREKAKTKIT